MLLIESQMLILLGFPCTWYECLSAWLSLSLWLHISVFYYDVALCGSPGFLKCIIFFIKYDKSSAIVSSNTFCFSSPPFWYFYIYIGALNNDSSDALFIFLHSFFLCSLACKVSVNFRFVNCSARIWASLVNFSFQLYFLSPEFLFGSLKVCMSLLVRAIWCNIVSIPSFIL